MVYLQGKKGQSIILFFNCTIIILPLIVSFFNAFYPNSQNKIIRFIVVLLPLLVSLLTSISILFRFLEKWNSCRYTVSKANVLLDRYVDLQKKNNFETKNRLHEEFAKIISKENKNWKKTQKHRGKMDTNI